MISLAEKVNEEVETNTTHVDEAVTTANGASQKATKASEEVQKAITEANTTLQEANAAKVSAQESATASAGSASAAASSASAASGSAADAAASAKAVEDIAAGMGGFDGTATSVSATDTHNLGSTNVQGQLDALAAGLDNVDMSASSVTAVDTQGIAVNAGESSTVQALIDVIADKVMTKLLEKTAIVQVESTATNKVPSSAYLKQVKDSIDSNLEWKLNGTYKATDTCPLPEKYNELMIKIYRTSDNAYTCGVNILKAELGKNTGNWMTGCGRDASGWDVKIVIAITSTIAINSVFINAADNKSNFSFVVYYR